MAKIIDFSFFWCTFKKINAILIFSQLRIMYSEGGGEDQKPADVMLR